MTTFWEPESLLPTALSNKPNSTSSTVIASLNWRSTSPPSAPPRYTLAVVRFGRHATSPADRATKHNAVLNDIWPILESPDRYTRPYAWPSSATMATRAPAGASTAAGRCPRLPSLSSNTNARPDSKSATAVCGDGRPGMSVAVHSLVRSANSTESSPTCHPVRYSTATSAPASATTRPSACPARRRDVLAPSGAINHNPIAKSTNISATTGLIVPAPGIIDARIRTPSACPSNVIPLITIVITTADTTTREDQCVVLAEYSMWRNVGAKSCNADTPQG